jgi:hypothetical protein
LAKAVPLIPGTPIQADLPEKTSVSKTIFPANQAENSDRNIKNTPDF